MMHRIFTLALLLCSVFLSTLQYLHAESIKPLNQEAEQNEFMPSQRAFAFDFKQQDNQLVLHWQIQPGYYLYRQQLKIVPQQAMLGAFVIPDGISYQDEFYGTIPIFKQELTVTLPITRAAEGSHIQVTYQGCAAARFCYPPETRTIPLHAITPKDPQLPLQRSPNPTELPFSPFWALLIGIAIAFTPCVLPMYPLIAAIILGPEKPRSPRQIFWLALTYVQGMALTYTLLGWVVARAGLQFQTALQHPYVLFTLSALFILLALSMFGFYSINLPSHWQTRLVAWSNHQKSGSVVGVFIMGALAGLICSPCTTAPLSAILLYIAQSGNTLAGGAILYLYALGMGLPLIIVTLFGNRILPRSGLWMQYTKEAFGFVILALPVFLLERVLGNIWGARLWSLLAVIFFSWAFVSSLTFQQRWKRLIQILLLVNLLIVVQPLQNWVFTADLFSRNINHSLRFQRVENLSQLHEALRQAKGKSVMLDLYADWCGACKELEKYTFSDLEVQKRLANTVLLQVDLTKNSPEQLAILKKLQVLGLPSILFFNPQGQEINQARISGFINASDFTIHLQNILF
ncbi:protein-disulfide reductase DsbD [Candidatus Regiella insecticola]|uniref:Thiol:disulfide interchange protein DsbD n=1 Tax=Candidatus Regiella insecticola TaxID=138073 RepID=A0A6L2ZQR5_9ENTR|nr:protein-disulfide reductase DsbD [Candidatus Regiella insecticola]GFN46571.1 thiol:disulfide interchange protein DsbD [Candidatus Regiella insecticola]